jgi:hypothetical protein
MGEKGSCVVVLDVDSDECRLGMAGDDQSTVAFAPRANAESGGDWLVNQGRIEGERNWQLFHHCLSQQFTSLRRNPIGEEEGALLVADRPSATLNQYDVHPFRIKVAEMFFESLNLPALSFVSRPVLSSLAYGRKMAMSMHIGYDYSWVVPIVPAGDPCCGVGWASQVFPVGAKHVVARLNQILTQASKAELKFKERKEEVDFLLSHALVAPNPDSSADPTLDSVSRREEKVRRVQTVHELAQSPKSHFSLLPAELHDQVLSFVWGVEGRPREAYQLPDGQVIFIPELASALEPLFSEGKIHELNSELKADMTLMHYLHQPLDHWEILCYEGNRVNGATIWTNVCVSGRTFSVPGFFDRLQFEMKNRYEMLHSFGSMGGSTHARLVRPMDKIEDVIWVGGSILGSLSTFPRWCMSAQTYQEEGPDAIRRTFFM